MSVSETINTIRKYAANRENIVDFSGGKYSLVLLHLVLRALGKAKALYIDTTISMPECTGFVNEICDEWGVELITVKRKDLDFWELVKRRGFPHRRFRWCMKEFKSTPLRLFNESFDGEVLHFVGTSMFESSIRKEIYAVRGVYHYNYSIGSDVLHPILKWTEDMVNGYIEANNLPLNPCYQKYDRGGNCYYCPHEKSLAYYSKLAEHQPRLFSKIVEAEKAMRHGGAAIYLGKGKLLYLGRAIAKLSTSPPQPLTLHANT
jgi:phosphoadenosine phosphosulfate reductase